MRRPRFRIWVLMIAVAFAALALGAWAAKRRLEYRRLVAEKQRAYLAEALNHAAHEARLSKYVQSMEKLQAVLRTVRDSEKGTSQRARGAFKRPTGDFELSPETARWLQEQWTARERSEQRLHETAVKETENSLDAIHVDIITARKRLVQHQQSRQKYERAARYPWLPVEPDPPEPPMPASPR